MGDCRIINQKYKVKKILSSLNLKSFSMIEFGLLIVLVVMIPWTWKYSLWVVGLLVVNTIFKCIAERRVGNSLLSKWGKLGLLATALLIGWYAISMLWTADKDLGGEMLTTKLSMLLLVAVFLCSDMSYGDRRHVRILMYGLVLSLISVFFYRVGVAVHKAVTTDSELMHLLLVSFDTGRHHAYMALYAMVALWWLYREVVEEWKVMKGWMKVCVSVCIVLLIVDVIFVNSRAGILVLWASTVLVPIHLIFFRKKTTIGLIWLLVLVAGMVGIFMGMPDKYNRVVETAEKVATEEMVIEKVDEEKEPEAVQSDARFTIWKVALNVANDEWLWGTGIGDRADEMEAEYKALGWEERRQNAHNQYLDTLVSTGVLGLLLLLTMFGFALWDAWKQRSLVQGALVAIMAFNMLFETMFDRQMGLIFWGLMLGLLSLESAKNYMPKQEEKVRYIECGK